MFTLSGNTTQTKFCKHCGEKIDVDAVVCIKCGKQVEKLENNSSSQAPMVFMNSSSSSAAAASSSSSGFGRRMPYPTNKVSVHILLFLFTMGIGNVIYYLYIKEQQKKWHMNN